MAGEMVPRNAVNSVTEADLVLVPPNDLEPGKGQGNVWTSLKPVSDADKAKLMNALQGDLPKLGDNIGKTIWVENVTFQEVELVNKSTGEVNKAIRTVLILKGGDMLSAVSDGVRASIGMACRIFRYPPWIPPMPFKIGQINTGGGKRFYVLNVDEEALSKSHKK